MDFSAWSPSHLIIAAITIGTIIAHVAYVFRGLKSSIDHLSEKMDIRFNAIDKRFDDVNNRIDDVNNQLIDVRQELRQLNQNQIDHLNQHNQ